MNMIQATQQSATEPADEAVLARRAAAAFPDAPLAMPVQDMSPAPVATFLRDLIPAILRRRARGGKVVGH